MSTSQRPASPGQRLIIVSGEEGAGNPDVAATVQRIKGAIPEVYAD